MIYTGIGSRETPPDIIALMERIAARQASKSATLRSGGAPGADQAFERGAKEAGGALEIYLPWKGFEGNNSPFWEATEAAHEMAARFHPHWANMKQSVRRLHARNCHQVMGLDLATPTSYVICYTRDGADGVKIPVQQGVTGGTGQAIRIAAHFGITVWNLGNPFVLDVVRKRYEI